MSKHNYITTIAGAKAVGRDLPISTKHSVVVCTFIRGKDVQLAKQLLKEVIALKRPVPYKQYNWDLGHKRGMTAGRYPIKTSAAILKVLESAEINAQFKGMNTAHLRIAHVAAHGASRPYHASRHRGHHMKRTHVECILQEYKVTEKTRKTEKKTEAQQAHKTEKNVKSDKK